MRRQEAINAETSAPGAFRTPGRCSGMTAHPDLDVIPVPLGHSLSGAGVPAIVVAMKLLLVAMASALLPGCGVFPTECTEMGCSGIAEVGFVDSAGNVATPSGQVRQVGDPDAQPFDCAVTSDTVTEYADCENGVLFLGFVEDGTERYEVRFELAGGGLSDWQEVQLDSASHTDPDFNGPGCACTWWDPTVEPIVVPPGAA